MGQGHEGGAGATAAAAAVAFERWTLGRRVAQCRARGVGEARGLKLGKAQAPVRVAVTGRSVGLPLFESLEVLGRERTLARLAAARDRLPA